MSTFQRKTACKIYFPMNFLERSFLWGRGIYITSVFFLLVSLFINLVISLFVCLFILIFITFFKIFFYFINHRQAKAYPMAYPTAQAMAYPRFCSYPCRKQGDQLFLLTVYIFVKRLLKIMQEITLQFGSPFKLCSPAGEGIW